MLQSKFRGASARTIARTPVGYGGILTPEKTDRVAGKVGEHSAGNAPNE